MNTVAMRISPDIILRAKWLFFKADIEPLRFFIATGSLLWALLLMLPGATFQRPTYAIMSAMASEVVWALGHLIHAILIYLDLLGYRTKRYGHLVAVSGPVLGCLLWTTSSVAMLLAVYPLPAAIAPNIVGGAVAWWLLVRCRD